MSTAATKITVTLQNYYEDPQGDYIMMPGVQDIISAFNGHAVDGSILVGTHETYQGGTNGPDARTYTFFTTDFPGFITAYDIYINSLQLPAMGIVKTLSSHDVQLGG